MKERHHSLERHGSDENQTITNTNSHLRNILVSSLFRKLNTDGHFYPCYKWYYWRKKFYIYFKVLNILL